MFVLLDGDFWLRGLFLLGFVVLFLGDGLGGCRAFYYHGMGLDRSGGGLGDDGVVVCIEKFSWEYIK